jgi:hypothetical protein
MGKLLKYQEEFLTHLNKMTNEEILKERDELFCGDGEDGYYSTECRWKLQHIEVEFIKRLKECDFLK